MFKKLVNKYFTTKPIQCYNVSSIVFILTYVDKGKESEDMPFLILHHGHAFTIVVHAVSINYNYYSI